MFHEKRTCVLRMAHQKNDFYRESHPPSLPYNVVADFCHNCRMKFVDAFKQYGVLYVYIRINKWYATTE
jgi:hypothetical protein